MEVHQQTRFKMLKPKQDEGVKTNLKQNRWKDTAPTRTFLQTPDAPRLRDKAKSKEIGICMDIEAKPAALFQRPQFWTNWKDRIAKIQVV